LLPKSEADHYDTERIREEWEVRNCIQEEIQEIIDIMEPYGLDERALKPIIQRFKDNPDKFVDFMMKFELNLEKPDPSRSWKSAITIGIAYFIGGLIPLIPYFFVDTPFTGLCISSGITLLCLVVFGFIKSLFIAPNKAYVASVQTAFVGALAAGSAYGGVTLIDYIFQK